MVVQHSLVLTHSTRTSQWMDAHSSEQGQLLEAFHFGNQGHAEPPGSISPYVPCASGRIPAVLRAARLTASDVFWDLGCGDGRICHQAAAQYGCHSVGVEIVEPCIVEAAARAAEQQLGELCHFAVCDLMQLTPGALRPDGEADGTAYARLGDARLSEDDDAEPLRAPTCVVLFITSHGLSRLKGWLRGEWERGGLRIITCVERLDECFDFEAENPLFADDDDTGAAAHPWPIYTAFEADGVFVVPPFGTSVEAWAAQEVAWAPAAPLSLAAADRSEPTVLRAVLTPNDIADLAQVAEACAAASDEGAAAAGAHAWDGFDLFDDEALVRAEDCMHASREHRVLHLHRGGCLQAALPRLLDRLLSCIRQADAARWRLLVGRAVGLRSAEWHTYQPGGGVTDPQHRDAGSLLTLSVLLTPPDAFDGGQLRLMRAGEAGAESGGAESGGTESRGTESGDAGSRGDGWVTPQLSCGDGVLFTSEKRHTVSTLTRGERRAFIIELWAGPTNAHNRHK